MTAVIVLLGVLIVVGLIVFGLARFIVKEAMSIICVTAIYNLVPLFVSSVTDSFTWLFTMLAGIVWLLISVITGVMLGTKLKMQLSHNILIICIGLFIGLLFNAIIPLFSEQLSAIAMLVATDSNSNLFRLVAGVGVAFGLEKLNILKIPVRE